MSGFTYLHAHSEFSLLDGCLTIEGYLSQLHEIGVSRAALTDTHNLFGAVKFFKTARKYSMEPIFGVDLLVRSGKQGGWGRNSPVSHLLVYVQNRTGYSRLCKLLSQSYRRRRDRGLHVSVKELAAKPEGLLFLGPPGPGSKVPPDDPKTDTYRERVRIFKETFGERAGIEVPVYRRMDQSIATRIQLARTFDLSPVITHPTFFKTPGDFETLKIRRAIQTNTTLKELDSIPEHRSDQSLISPRTLKEQLPGNEDQLMRNTSRWTEECTFRFETESLRLPAYPFGPDDSAQLLERRCRETLRTKSFDTDEETARTRLEHELNTIQRMDYADYFLIVADIVNWARNNGIRVGPGRGSAAGSFVAYLMNITTVDPFQYNLIFERFLNPDRNEMPDIDVDFADHQRERILQYIRDRFGEDSVAHIITFGRLRARNSIRDVGRVREEPQKLIDDLAESVPPDEDFTLSELLSTDSIFSEKNSEETDLERWLDQARRVEGFIRNPSVHAAGILITQEKIDDCLPLYRDSGSSAEIASQFDMYDLEDLGYLKLDVLGLTTLTLIDKVLNQIPESERPDLVDLPGDDLATLQLFADGKLEGVFQFESPGGRRLAEKMEPRDKREVIDCIALNRPGPAQYRDDYLERRAGITEVEYPHKDLEQILENTYGLIIYQEQVMAIARRIGGLSWSESDTLRKAMGKKKAELMEEVRTKFINGACKNGYDREFAKGLFEKLSRFAEYGFNRSHSAAYGEITYQTAYLKAHFPQEFYAAFLTLKASDRERIRTIVESMRQEGIKILPPDVNQSTAEFHVDKGGVRYGLRAVKHVGSELSRTIEDERGAEPYRDLDDFLARIPPHQLSSRSFKALAAGGCFDNLTSRNRSELIETAEEIVGHGKKRYAEARAGQSTLFKARDAEGKGEEKIQWPRDRLHRAQREALGVNFDRKD